MSEATAAASCPPLSAAVAAEYELAADKVAPPPPPFDLGGTPVRAAGGTGANPERSMGANKLDVEALELLLDGPTRAAPEDAPVVVDELDDEEEDDEEEEVDDEDEGKAAGADEAGDETPAPADAAPPFAGADDVDIPELSFFALSSLIESMPNAPEGTSPSPAHVR